MRLHALMSSLVHSHPEGTQILHSVLPDAEHAHGVVRLTMPNKILASFVRVEVPLCHSKLENTDVFKQRWRFFISRVVSQSMLVHFSDTPWLLASLFVIGEPMLLQR